MTSDVKLREALEVIAEGGCECVGEHHPKELCAGCIARDALAAAPSAEPEGDGRVLRLAGRYSGVRYGNAAIPCEFDAVEIFEMLRAAPPAETGEGWKTLCVECGPNVPIDEDFCCTTCGASAVGQWLESLATPVDPPTGECERCGTCGMFPTEGNMVIQRTPDGGMRTVPCPDCSKTCENPACVDGTVPTRPQTGYPGALHEPCPDCSGACDDPDDCPTYDGGCRCVEARRDGPERIYLEPPPGSPDTGRLWCEDDQSEDDRLWVPYVRADLAITPEWRRNAFAGQPPEEQNATAGDGEGEVVEGWVIEEDLRDMDFPKAYIRVWLGVVPRHSVPASVRIVRDPTGDAPGGEA